MGSIVLIVTSTVLLAPLGVTHAQAMEPALRPIELPGSAVRISLEAPMVVDARALEPDLVCERYVPTGSRISSERCVLRADSELSATQRRILRRDIEAMRRMQTDRAMATQRAAEAFRQAMIRGTAGNN